MNLVKTNGGYKIISDDGDALVTMSHGSEAVDILYPLNKPALITCLSILAGKILSMESLPLVSQGQAPSPLPYRTLPTSEEANRVVDNLLKAQYAKEKSTPIEATSPGAIDVQAALANPNYTLKAMAMEIEAFRDTGTPAPHDILSVWAGMADRAHSARPVESPAVREALVWRRMANDLADDLKIALAQWAMHYTDRADGGDDIHEAEDAEAHRYQAGAETLAAYEKLINQALSTLNKESQS